MGREQPLAGQKSEQGGSLPWGRLCWAAGAALAQPGRDAGIAQRVQVALGWVLDSGEGSEGWFRGRTERSIPSPDLLEVMCPLMLSVLSQH